MIIVSDIAGQYNALVRMMARFPGEDFVFVGDLVDRGPESDKVIEIAMKNPRVTTLLGNHEHMMLDFFWDLGLYQQGLWLYNGGVSTHRSYNHAPPAEVLTWIAKLPLFKMVDNCLITHAPLQKGLEIDALENAHPRSPNFNRHLIWNREEPVRRPYFQIFGHNSHWGVISIQDDQGEFARCIDGTREDMLTAIHWPSLETYQEPYELSIEPIIEGFPIKEVAP